jgi:hypothetical protein
VDTDGTYRMSGKRYSYDELIAALDAEAATLDPDQWEGGWDPHEYLIEALLVGVIEAVHPDDEGDARVSRCWRCGYVQQLGSSTAHSARTASRCGR